jgi:hypothetical protein
MQVVLMDIKVKPRNGSAWTSHSLRKGATTAASAIGVTMQKIQFFVVTESSVYCIDYIDPVVVVPTAAD